MEKMKLNEVDKVEILTLEDNFVDLVSGDNSAIVARAVPVKDMKITNSILAEHGFSALITLTIGDQSRTMIFDFGFSKDVAARNADSLNIDLTKVEVAALSHGHLDHYGGLGEIAARIGKKNIELVLHPVAFRKNRSLEPIPGIKIGFLPPDKDEISKAGFTIAESKKPRLLLDGNVLFLGEIPRKTAFEKGLPYAFYEQDNQNVWDPTEDDTGLAINVRGKGLVVLSGCAHSGIINTVQYAKEITDIDKVHVVMGGLHLTGPAFEPIIGDTVESLKKISPDYVIPTHCTGRKASLSLEQAMPGKFIVNMSGTKLTFAA